jgi:hypothetical protein
MEKNNLCDFLMLAVGKFGHFSLLFTLRLLILMILIKQAEELAAALAASKGNHAQNDTDGVRMRLFFINIKLVLNQ